MSTFLRTRRNALIGGLTSLLVPSAAINLGMTAEIRDPRETITEHTFALQDAIQAITAALHEMDGDFDFEDADDSEPSPGWLGTGPHEWDDTTDSEMDTCAVERS